METMIDRGEPPKAPVKKAGGSQMQPMETMIDRGEPPKAPVKKWGRVSNPPAQPMETMIDRGMETSQGSGEKRLRWRAGLKPARATHGNHDQSRQTPQNPGEEM